MYTEKDVLALLKKEWSRIDKITEKHPDLCEKLVNEFFAVCQFAGELTGKRYTVVEDDGVIEY